MDTSIPQNLAQCAFDFEAMEAQPFEQPSFQFVDNQNIAQRQCTACLKFLPATPQFFYRNSYQKSVGLQSKCKQCHKEGRSPVKREIPEGHRFCNGCQKILPATPEFFYKQPEKKHGLQPRCKTCFSVYYERHYEKQTLAQKRMHQMRRYGMTLGQYEQMFADQNGVCACCGHPETRINPITGKIASLAVDHDHSTGKVRALLCHHCNTAFGNLREDPVRITALLRYAELWQTGTQ